MGDIEDLLAPGTLPLCSRTQERCPLPQADPARGPSASARVRQLMRHLSSSSDAARSRDCSACPGRLHRRTAASASIDTGTKKLLEGADLGRWLEEATALPVRNPYGEMLEIPELARRRKQESAPRRQISQSIRDKKIDPPHDMAKLTLTGEFGEWPYLIPGVGTKYMTPWMMSEEVKTITMPILKRLVDNVANKTTDMPYPPLVSNGWETYVDPDRHTREVNALKSTFLFAGVSSDLGTEPNAFLRVELMGKSVLLTRDSDGRFRAFENVCRHRGMELVTPHGQENIKTNGACKGVSTTHVCPYHSWAYDSSGKLVAVPFEQGFDNDGSVDIENRNLIELPCGERAGILFVVPFPDRTKSSAFYNDQFEDVLNPELAAELDAYQMSRFSALAQQDFRMSCNWKLPIDTFGEAYHFNTLHPELRETNIGNRIVWRTWEDRHGTPKNSCMTLGRTQIKHLAAGGVPESQWSEPSPLAHITQTFMIAPNTSVIFNSDGMLITQAWPGSNSAECVVTVARYVANLPKTPEELQYQRNAFSRLLDVVATEDFAILHNMQQSFTHNKHAETIFGRHEPALTYRHRVWNAMIGK